MPPKLISKLILIFYFNLQSEKLWILECSWTIQFLDFQQWLNREAEGVMTHPKFIISRFRSYRFWIVLIMIPSSTLVTPNYEKLHQDITFFFGFLWLIIVFWPLQSLINLPCTKFMHRLLDSTSIIGKWMIVKLTMKTATSFSNKKRKIAKNILEKRHQV